MKRFFLVNRSLILLFAVASGIYKIAGGAADTALFAHVGLTPSLVVAFGVLQALAGIGLALQPTRRTAAVLLTGCNTFATSALFVCGIQPFGTISVLFIAMAFLEIFDVPLEEQRFVVRSSV